MILIITHKDDFTADLVINKLNNRGIKYFRLNCEDIDNESYIFQNNNNFNFKINEIENFDSVWFRRTKLPEINIDNDAEKIFILNDYDTLLSNIFHLISTKKWLSHPKHVYAAENKILQLRTAKAIGFVIPDTLITNSHKNLNNFINNHKKIIIKPIRQGRIRYKDGFKTIFTNNVDDETIGKIKYFDLTPCIIQKYIEKDYELRVTVVGEKVFSAKIESQKYEETKIDWRKEKRQFQPYILPKNISEKCVALTKELNLSFGAIDLIKNKNGEYLFLEINPNGQWAWLELENGLNISDEIIRFLTSK